MDLKKCNCYTYKNELKQVFVNILNNAKDALIEHKIKDPHISIKTSCNNNSVSVVFSDNAGGIPKDIIDKVFEPYFTTKFQTAGTGIGLYMSKTIIENNIGGALDVHNDSNGAVFTIELKKFQENN